MNPVVENDMVAESHTIYMTIKYKKHYSIIQKTATISATE